MPPNIITITIYCTLESVIWEDVAWTHQYMLSVSFKHKTAIPLSLSQNDQQIRYIFNAQLGML